MPEPMPDPMNDPPARGYTAMLPRCMTFFTVLAWAGSAAAQEPPPGPPPAPATAPSPDAPIATITGRVIDALGRPVAGARVSVDGGSKTARTDRSGTF